MKVSQVQVPPLYLVLIAASFIRSPPATSDNTPSQAESAICLLESINLALARYEGEPELLALAGQGLHPSPRAVGLYTLLARGLGPSCSERLNLALELLDLYLCM